MDLRRALNHTTEPSFIGWGRFRLYFRCSGKPLETVKQLADLILFML